MCFGHGSLDGEGLPLRESGEAAFRCCVEFVRLAVIAEPEKSVQDHTPAVTARKSLASPDHIISMIDGKPYKTVRRHLSTNGLTPDEYRQRYNLKTNSPMVTAFYSEARRTMAKAFGLGHKAGVKIANVEQKVEKGLESVVKTAAGA